MYRIEEAHFGYRMTFEGFIRSQEMAEWGSDLRTTVNNREGGWGNLVDMRGSATLPADTMDELFSGIEYCRSTGLNRVAVVVSNPISKLQAMRVVKESGIDDIVTFVDASTDPEWEKSALGWIRDGDRPD